MCIEESVVFVMRRQAVKVGMGKGGGGSGGRIRSSGGIQRDLLGLGNLENILVKPWPILGLCPMKLGGHSFDDLKCTRKILSAPNCEAHVDHLRSS